jgi:hypothetical protein
VMWLYNIPTTLMVMLCSVGFVLMTCYRIQRPARTLMGTYMSGEAVSCSLPRLTGAIGCSRSSLCSRSNWLRSSSATPTALTKAGFPG